MGLQRRHFEAIGVAKADQLNQAEVFQAAGLQSSRFAIAR